MRLLTPTENHRLNELIGFLGLTLAVLLTLALISYSPHDASFNVSTPLPDGHAPANWIGPVGAYGADLVFQAFGYAAFLLTLGLFGLGWRWLRSQALNSAVVKLAGYALLVLFFPALLTLWHIPDVRGAIPPGGLLGTLVASGLRAGFGPAGAHVMALATLVTGLFLATPFSFTGLHAVVGEPIRKLDPIGRLKTRWSDWHKQQELDRNRKRLEDIKTSGRKPVPTQTVNDKATAKEALAEESRRGNREDDEEHEEEERRAPVLIVPGEAPAAKVNAIAEPKIAKGATNFRLPSTDILRKPERTEKIEEDELKECARAIEQKCREFGVGGQITQINPGPVVTTYEFKPEAGIKYSRITSLADDLCLALRAESILIERIPGKSTVGIEVPNQHRQTIALREVVESPEFVNLAVPHDSSLGQGPDRPHPRFRPGSNAALAHCRINRHRQERVPEFADRFHAVQGHPGRVEDGHDRSKETGVGTLRKHSPPAGSGGHRPQGGLQRIAQRHPRNGAAAETTGAARHDPQHR